MEPVTIRLFDVALQLEEMALKDDYFNRGELVPETSRFLLRCDSFSAIGLPEDMFTACSPLPARSAGWFAQCERAMSSDPAAEDRPPARQLSTPAPVQRGESVPVGQS